MARRGRPPRELTPLASAWHRLGAELRSLREDRGLTQAHLGKLVLCSGALVGKIEMGKRKATLDTIERADAVLDAGGALNELWHEAQQPDTDHASPDAAQLVEASLQWIDDVSDAVGVTCSMWQTEATERTPLAATSWAPGAYAGPLRSSLTRMPDAIGDRPGRMISRAEVDGLWIMSEYFTDADHRLGGGYARSTLIHYLDVVVRPLLMHGGFTDRVGRDLFGAAARLCNLCAFMSFDSAEQGLAQRYFLRALRLAHASGNRALIGHILGDMSMQAHHLGDAGWALQTAEAGYTAAIRGGSASTAARCAVLQGRAHALRGDPAGAARGRLLAEQHLDKNSDSEPGWIRFFTAEQLAVESQYIASDLGQHSEVKRLASTIASFATDPATTSGMQRRRVLSTATLASAYLPRADRRSGYRGTGPDLDSDIDHACHLVTEVLPALPALTSARARSRVDKIRRSLTPYRDRASVVRLEAAHHSLSATPAAAPYWG